jgi:FMN reductase
MRSAVLVGNPKPGSRTLEAACSVVQRVTGAGPDLSVDLVGLGPSLLDWSAPEPAAVLADIGQCDLVVVGSPTYKGTFTGVLKLFLDRADRDALRGVTAVPLMLGAVLCHSLAPDVFLRPVLLELGASCPTAGLFLLDSDYLASERLEAWLPAAVPQIEASVGSSASS